ncbi:MAG: hypothetical protein R2865_07540 [Deinococcales bacterium]
MDSFVWLFACPVAPWLHARLKGVSAYLLALLPLPIGLYLTGFYQAVIEGESVRSKLSWFSDKAIYLSFHLDGLSLIFSLLISFCGLYHPLRLWLSQRRSPLGALLCLSADVHGLDARGGLGR